MGAILSGVLLVALFATHLGLMTGGGMWLQLMLPATMLVVGHAALTTKRFLMTERVPMPVIGKLEHRAVTPMAASEPFLHVLDFIPAAAGLADQVLAHDPEKAVTGSLYLIRLEQPIPVDQDQHMRYRKPDALRQMIEDPDGCSLRQLDPQRVGVAGAVSDKCR